MRSTGSPARPATSRRLFALEARAPREPRSADEWRRSMGSGRRELRRPLVHGPDARAAPPRLARGYVAGRLRAAARAGMPLVLTLAELRPEPLRLAPGTLFVCENPSIVVAAAAALGSSCPPLLCTEGWPNTAAAAMLDAAEAAGMVILVHADSDEAGAAIAARVLARPGARPWRVSIPRPACMRRRCSTSCSRISGAAGSVNDGSSPESHGASAAAQLPEQRPPAGPRLSTREPTVRASASLSVPECAGADVRTREPMANRASRGPPSVGTVSQLQRPPGSRRARRIALPRASDSKPARRLPRPRTA